MDRNKPNKSQTKPKRQANQLANKLWTLSSFPDHGRFAWVQPHSLLWSGLSKWFVKISMGVFPLSRKLSEKPAQEWWKPDGVTVRVRQPIHIDRHIGDAYMSRPVRTRTSYIKSLWFCFLFPRSIQFTEPPWRLRRSMSLKCSVQCLAHFTCGMDTQLCPGNSKCRDRKTK